MCKNASFKWTQHSCLLRKVLSLMSHERLAIFPSKNGPFSQEAYTLPYPDLILNQKSKNLVAVVVPFEKLKRK